MVFTDFALDYGNESLFGDKVHFEDLLVGSSTRQLPGTAKGS